MPDQVLMSGDKQVRIAYARAVFRGRRSLFTQDNQELLEASIRTGTETTRYGKQWRLGPVSTTQGHVRGRLGFERERPKATEVWDADKQDFVATLYPTGASTPFSVRVGDMTIAYQLQGSDIDEGSFRFALAKLMTLASGEMWAVEPIGGEATFDGWRARTPKVVEVDVTVQPPNPNYSGRPDVQSFLEGPNATLANARWVAEEGLDVEDALIQQFIEHADRRGYGHLSATGERDGRTVKYVRGVEPRIDTVTPDAQTGDVGLDILDQMLEQGDLDGSST